MSEVAVQQEAAEGVGGQVMAFWAMVGSHREDLKQSSNNLILFIYLFTYYLFVYLYFMYLL